MSSYLEKQEEFQQWDEAFEAWEDSQGVFRSGRYIPVRNRAGHYQRQMDWCARRRAENERLFSNHPSKGGKAFLTILFFALMVGNVAMVLK